MSNPDHDRLPFESLSIVANELRHRVLRWRTSEAPPRGVAILLHGFQDAASSWDDVAPCLAREGFDVIAPDLRGFGDSEQVGAGGYYHFYDYIFDVADLVDEVSRDAPVSLVGHSMGGTVSVLYAGSFPERVRSLALLEGLGPPESPIASTADRVRHWVDGVRAMRLKQERAIPLELAARRLGMSHPNVAPAIIERRTAQLTRPLADGSGYVWRFDPRHRTTSPIGFSVDRWQAHAARLTMPLLIVGGGSTGFHPPDEEARIAQLAHVTRVDFEGAGHMMHWTVPNELGAALAAHFTK